MIRNALVLSALLVGCKTENDLLNGNNGNNTPDDTDTDVVVDGDAPDILVTPEAISFGTKLPDCPSDALTITIQNVGASDLIVDQISLVGDGSSAYTMIGAVPDTLAPNAAMQVDVIFEAGATIDYPAEIDVVSNDPDSPHTGVGLEGSGGLNASNEDLFFQDNPSAVDILWVLDNSCSMSDDQAALETEFDNFIASYATLGLDYQLAVTTTDMDNPAQAGRLQGAGVISPSIAAAAGTTVMQMFDDAVEPNSLGSATEKAFAASHAALGSPGYAVSAGLIRPDANLAIIFVGDEDDNTSESASAFGAWFEGLKSDPSKTTVSGIIQQQSSLFDVSCSGFASPKMEEVIDSTGGIRTGICDLDFGQVLRWLSYSAAGLRSAFPLTDMPLNGAAGMQVTVNNAPIGLDPLRGNGWWYIRNNNSVVFYGDSLPGPGAEVRITYPIAGQCN